MSAWSSNELSAIMPIMKSEEIKNLARLARIEVTDEEVAVYEKDLSSIMTYVSAVSDIASDTVDNKPQVGARYNILRADKVTNEGGQFTEALLAEMPHTEGQYMKVKKILKTE